MKRLHLFIIKSFLGPLILTFFIVLFVLLMQFMWRYVDEFVGKGLEWYVIAEFILYASSTLVPMAIPLAVLLAGLMTFGNLGENYELTAIKAAGISLRKIMMPLFMICFLISCGAFFFSNNVMPVANLKLYTLLHSIRQHNPEMEIKPGVFDNSLEGFSIKIDYKNTKTGLLKNILIYNHTENNGNTDVTHADSGFMKSSPDKTKILFTLYNGSSYVEEEKNEKRKDERTYPHRKQFFKKQVLAIDVEQSFKRMDESLFKSNYHMLSLDQLTKAKDSLEKVMLKRRSNFVKSLTGSNIFAKDIKRRLELEDSSTQKHELVFPDSLKELDIEKVLRSLNQGQLKDAVELAQSYARGTQNSISSTGEQVYDRSETVRRYDIERHNKFTLATACLVFFFIGAPLGAIIRKGGLGTPVIISVLFFIAYYMISLSGLKIVRSGILSAHFGMWISTIILVPLGAFLTYQATTDSALMNKDTYVNLFKKLKRLLVKEREGHT